MFCDIRNARWKEYIEKRYLEGANILQIERELKGLGFKATDKPIKRHLLHAGLFKKEVLEPEIIEEKRRKELDLLAESEKNLTMLRDMTSKFVGIDMTNPEIVNATKGLLTETRLTLESIQNMKEKAFGRAQVDKRALTKMMIEWLKEVPTPDLLILRNKLEADLKGEKPSD